MGLIILPYILGAIIIFLAALYMIVMQNTADVFNTTNILFGIVLTILIYGAIISRYIYNKKYWGLSPIFIFPFFMIYLPFLIVLLTRSNFGFHSAFVSNSVLISILASGVLITISYNYIFIFLDKFGVKRHY